MSDIGRQLSLISCFPFLGILLSIAVIPMVSQRFWNRYFGIISFGWALLFAIPFVAVYGIPAARELAQIISSDYLSFIILLGGLFVVSGGIHLKGKLEGTPIVNVAILILGTVLASIMGTTGAAILLIRPLIRANEHRVYRAHTVIFFIFLVANIGGCLTPLGDPPLFIGYLQGVPFFWTFRLLPQLLLTAGTLLAAYFVLDSIFYHKERHKRELVTNLEGLRLVGSHNFIFLLAIVPVVLMSGAWRLGDLSLFGVERSYQSLLRDLLIILIAGSSYLTTKKEIRRANRFDWFPIKEVAYLFFGIFVTIIPPLLILRSGSEGVAAGLIDHINSPTQYLWAAGSLSAILDNAPTYLAFFNLALGKLSLNASSVPGLLGGTLTNPLASTFALNLEAISVGAVFFGAMTYIGNAPNFMVRLIAEEMNVKMPSFFGYLGWSCLILLPVLGLVTVVFF